jgi:hypothetical protein
MGNLCHSDWLRKPQGAVANRDISTLRPGQRRCVIAPPVARVGAGGRSL